MKNLFTLMSAAFLLSSCASMQPATETTKAIVIDAPNKDAEELFGIVQEWLVAISVNPKNTINIVDKDRQVIMAKLYTEEALRIVVAYPITFTWKFEIRDARLRTTMADIYLPRSPGYELTKSQYDQIWEWFDEQMKELKERLAAPTAADW